MSGRRTKPLRGGRARGLAALAGARGRSGNLRSRPATSSPTRSPQESFAASIQKDPEVTFDPRRWFARDGELIVHSGRTYALHSNWGGQQTIDWLFELSERWPNDGVEIRIHQEGPASDAA